MEQASQLSLESVLFLHQCAHKAHATTLAWIDNADRPPFPQKLPIALKLVMTAFNGVPLEIGKVRDLLLYSPNDMLCCFLGEQKFLYALK